MADIGTLLVDGDGTSPRAWTSQAFGNIDEGIASADGLYAHGVPAKDLSVDTSFTLAATPTDLSNVDTLLYNIRYQQSGYADDGLYVGVRIVNGATILAAADSGGSFAEIGAFTNTAWVNSGATSFAYVNTAATKATWDAAVVELRARNVGSKAGDNAEIRVDTVEFTGTYTAAAGGTAYDETGRTVAVVATVTSSDSVAFADSTTIPIVATISSTDVHTTGGTAYDETGLTVTVVAIVTGSDIVAFADATTVTVVATISSSDATGSTLHHDFEGESDETTITTSTSGPDTFDNVWIGTDAEAVYDTLRSKEGSASGRISTGATSTTANLNLDLVADSTGDLWGSVYLYRDDSVATNSYTILLRDDAGSVNVYVIRIQADDTWDVVQLVPSWSILGSSIGTIPIGEWIRFDFRGRGGNGDGIVTVRVFHGADLEKLSSTANATEEVEVTGITADYTLDQMRVGIMTGVANSPTYWFDDFQLSNLDWPTPTGTGTAYDETGLTVAVVATISETDTVAFSDDVSITATATIAETDMVAFTDDVAVAAIVTITSTDSTAYAETGRAVTIVATVSSTDGFGYQETGLTVPIVASTTSIDTAAFTDATTVSVAATVSVQDAAAWTETVTVASVATITETDNLGQYETALPVGIIATISATDDHTVAGQNYDETGRSFVVVATVTSTDEILWVEDTSFTVTATVTATDTAAFDDFVSVTVLSTVTATDVASFADDTTVSIVCTVSSTDNFNGVNFDETGLAFSVVATIASTDAASFTESVAVTVNSLTTVTATAAFTDDTTVSVVATITATDVYTSASQGYDETGRTVPVVATITSTDTAAFDETASVTIVSSISETDTAAYTDDTSVAVVATITETDSLGFDETGRSFAVVSTCTVTDGLGLYESVTVAVTAAWSTTDTFAGVDSTSVAAVATVASSDVLSLFAYATWTDHALAADSTGGAMTTTRSGHQLAASTSGGAMTTTRSGHQLAASTSGGGMKP